MSIAICPPSADLERLFLGGLPAAETQAIEQHVQQCRSCGAKLADLLAAKDTLVDLLSHDTQGDAFCSAPVVADLVKKLKSLRRATPSSVQQGTPMITIFCSGCNVFKKLLRLMSKPFALTQEQPSTTRKVSSCSCLANMRRL